MATVQQAASRKPHGVTPRYALALAAVAGIAIVAFKWSRSEPPAPPAPVPARDVTVDRTWWHEVRRTKSPSAAPTPYGAPTAVTTPVTMPMAEATPYPSSQSMTATSPEHSEAMRQYQRAVSSDLAIKIDNGKTLETPRLVDQQERRPILVNAKPAPPHTIAAWTFIYGMLETGIRSDHPGDVIGRVSQDVKDSVTQTEILIPMGSKLHGFQRGAQQVQLNDTSLVVTWDDIEFPNGGHVAIPKMPGTDSEGYPGLEDIVDRHLAQTWGLFGLVSAMSAGMALATRPTYGGVNGYDPTQMAGGAFAQSLGSRAMGQFNTEAMQNKPTLTIREGFPFRILVTRDLVFSGPYGQ